MRRSGPILLALLLGACTAATPVVDPSGSSTEPVPTESETPREPLPRARRAAVVVEDKLMIYEVASDTISELATGGGIEQPAWLSKNQVSVVQPSGTGSVIRAIDTQNRGTTDLLIVEGDLLSYDVSSDRGFIATMSAQDGFAVVEVHYLIGERPVQRIASIPTEARGGSIDDMFLVALSPDEQRLLIVHSANPGGTDQTAGLQVRRLDGALEYSVDSDRAPTMASWLPSGGLVFRSSDGVRRWKPGSSSSVGVGGLSTWFSPWPSPNSRVVAYDTGRVTRKVQVRRVVLATGKVTDLGPPGRANPVHAAGNEVWTQIVQRCQPDCLEPFVLGPIVYSINPNNGKEKVLKLPTLVGIALWSE